MAIFAWLTRNRVFDGLAGSIVVAVGVPGLLAAAYGYLQHYPRHTQNICMPEHGVLKDRDAHVFLLHIRDRIGAPKAGEPLWEQAISMKPSSGTPGWLCASVRYVEQGGIQFKVYVTFDSIQANSGTPDELLQKLREKITGLTDYEDCVPGDPLNSSLPSAQQKDCVTYDAYAATIWLLLKGYAQVPEGPYWNNWWVSPLPGGSPEQILGGRP
jgi:hypothetical protein